MSASYCTIACYNLSIWLEQENTSANMTHKKTFKTLSNTLQMDSDAKEYISGFNNLPREKLWRKTLKMVMEESTLTGVVKAG